MCHSAVWHQERELAAEDAAGSDEDGGEDSDDGEDGSGEELPLGSTGSEGARLHRIGAMLTYDASMYVVVGIVRSPAEKRTLPAVCTQSESHEFTHDMSSSHNNGNGPTPREKYRLGQNGVD